MLFGGIGQLGSFIGQIGRFLPYGVQGYRDAIQDEWTDRKNYEAVHEMQRNNLVNDMLAPFDYQAEAARAGDAVLRHYVNGLNTDLNRRMHPGRAAMADAFSGYAPHAGALSYGNELYQLMLIRQALLNGQLMPFGHGGNIPVPSALG